MDEKAKIFIGINSIRNPEWKHSTSLHKATINASNFGLPCLVYPIFGESLIQRGRNNMLREFQESKYDYLLTIDDDIVIPPDAIIKLYEAQKDIIGGFYRLKVEEQMMAMRTLTGERPSIKYFREIITEGEPVRMKYISTGCMMVRKQAVDSMMASYPETFYLQNMTGKEIFGLYNPFIYQMELLSEDWAFCQRALDIGIEVWAHPRVLCGHIGSYEFRIEGV